MSNRKLAILAVVAVAMVCWAIVQSHRSKGTPSFLPDHLLQGLDPADIYTVEIGIEDDVVRLTRQESQFVVANKENYPAAVKQINELITQCLDLKPSELISKSAANHADLEVTEDKAQHVIRFLDPEDKVITGLIIGKTRDGGQGQYVRQVGKDDVYLATDVPYFRTSATDYLDQALLSVEEKDIQSISLTGPKGACELVRQDGDKQYKYVNLPDGKQLKTTVATSLFGAMSSLRFDDVSKQAPEGVTFDSSLKCKLNSQAVYEFKLGKKGEDVYVTCQADYLGEKSVQLNTSQKDSKEELEKKEAVLLTQEKVQKFNIKNKGWTYKIPKWKADTLLKTPEDLLEDVKVETPAVAPDVNTPVIGPTLPDSNN
ncbi:MAG: DUF4340 domain-containing protein [Phycisphaerae bacterium]|nr:DUF4340 domain-containing protein [Phycisphaerae bacterium]